MYSYRDDVLAHVEVNKAAADIASQFSVAIQEWKNLLLRGSTADNLDAYWSAHQKAMAQVIAGIEALATKNQDEINQSTLVQLAAAMRQAAKGYENALAVYRESQFDFAAGDKAARGKDREAAALLVQLREHLSEQEALASEQASAMAQHGSQLAYGLMSLITLCGMAVSVWMSQRIVQPLNEAVHAVEQVARGDLTAQLHTTGRDEIASLLQSLQTMQSQLTDLVNKVRAGAQSVFDASSEIAQGNHNLSDRTEQQAATLQKAASSMDELSATGQRTDAGTAQAKDKAQHATQVAGSAGEVVAHMVQTMGDIHSSSNRIAEIIGVIDSIAFQTNILALNAAVEAARAGEQGRGFAVVAAEVRALSGRTATAAKEIKALIDASVSQVERGTQQVTQAGQTMGTVVVAIREVSAMVSDISQANHAQGIGISQVGEAVTEIDQVTQQNAALVEQIATAASSMSQQAHDLVDLVAVFKTR